LQGFEGVEGTEEQLEEKNVSMFSWRRGGEVQLLVGVWEGLGELGITLKGDEVNLEKELMGGRGVGVRSFVRTTLWGVDIVVDGFSYGFVFSLVV